LKTIKKLRKKHEGFTLLEMLIVLLVIAVLIILFVPNLSKQQSSINKQGDEALTKVIQTQSEMYYLDHSTRPKDLDELVQGGYISKEQKDKAEKIGISVE